MQCFSQVSLNLRAQWVDLRAEVRWPQATPSPCEGGGGLGHASFEKIWNLMLQKQPFYALLMVGASRFSSPDIPKNRSYSDHLPETLTEDEHFNGTG